MRSSRPLAASGLSNPLHYPTPLPDDGPPLSSGLSRASSAQQLKSDDNKPLLMLDTLPIVGFAGFCIPLASL
jgi:hypothetical protein